MARSLVKLQPTDVWGENLMVALTPKLLGDIVLQLLTNRRARRGPEDQALTDRLIDMKELERLTDNTVVTLSRLFQLVKMGL